MSIYTLILVGFLIILELTYGFQGISHDKLSAASITVCKFPRSISRESTLGYQSIAPKFRLRDNTRHVLFASLAESVSSVGNISSGTGFYGTIKKLKVGFLFALWYALNVGYNVYNKKVLNLVPELTYTVAFLQLFLGLGYVFPVWASGARKVPQLTKDEVKTLMPVAVLHCLTHLGAIVSLGAGAVSFTHIVKAAEPAVSAALSAVFLKQFLPLPVAITLIPVMGGVAIASLKELSFSWLAFCAAMVSNVASASRGIVGKLQMGKALGKNMNAANLYAVMTIISSALCLPLALILEGADILQTLGKLKGAGSISTLCVQTVASALFYYLYNEVAFLALDNVAPVTHALGNTIKRVVIILASVVWLGSTMTAQGIFGSTLAIGGVLLYSLAKDKYK